MYSIYTRHIAPIYGKVVWEKNKNKKPVRVELIGVERGEGGKGGVGVGMWGKEGGGEGARYEIHRIKGMYEDNQVR